MTTPAGWEGILDTDETILWQGKPVTNVRFEGSVVELLMGLFFVGFSINWMNMASDAPGPFWMFGLIFFFIGLYKAIGVHFWKAHLRGKTFYTLTNKRAFIATDEPSKGRRLNSYPIGPDTVLEFSGTNPATIIFAEKRLKRSKGGSRLQKIGFELIADGNEAFRLLRQVQTRADSDAKPSD